MTIIPIQACVSTGERNAVEAAKAAIVSAVGEVMGAVCTCDCTYVADRDALKAAPPGTIRLTSFVADLDRLDAPWPAEEARLRAAYAALSDSGVPVFICTILRHAGDDADRDLVYRRRVRIRRLNLLATEISREFGAFVIDIDRVVTDIGGRRLQTDYRLQGQATAEIAGNTIAITIIANGLDAFVPFDVQDAARDIVMQSQPRPALAQDVLPTNALALGRGRRKQVAATVIDTEQKNQAWRLLRQVLKRQIAPAEALGKLIQAMRRRGMMESAALLGSATLRMVGWRRT